MAEATSFFLLRGQKVRNLAFEAFSFRKQRVLPTSDFGFQNHLGNRKQPQPICKFDEQL